MEVSIFEVLFFLTLLVYTVPHIMVFGAVVGSVKFVFFSYRYRADKSTIFGMRGLWGLSINSGRVATLKYL